MMKQMIYGSIGEKAKSDIGVNMDGQINRFSEKTLMKAANVFLLYLEKEMFVHKVNSHVEVFQGTKKYQ